MNIKCFKHPTKSIEAVCTDPACNHYRFFCVTCFLEHSPHFINHKNQIYEIQEFLNSHQNSVLRTTGVQEIDGQLQSIKQYMKEYELLIKQKRQRYQQVFLEIEKKFEEAKQQCQKEVEEYLQIFIQKQQAHYSYLKKKVDMYKQEITFTDWTKVRRQNEQEVSFFFENIIKNQYNYHKEFKQEIKMYKNSFQRNIQDLDNSHGSKVVQICLDEMKSQFKDKFSELKEVLMVPNEEHLQYIKQSKIKNEQYQHLDPYSAKGNFGRSALNNNHGNKNSLDNSEIVINNNINTPLYNDFCEDSASVYNQQNGIHSTNNNNNNNHNNVSVMESNYINGAEQSTSKNMSHHHNNNNHNINTMNSHMNFFANSVNTNLSNNNTVQLNEIAMKASKLAGFQRYNNNNNNDSEIELESDADEDYLENATTTHHSKMQQQSNLQIQKASKLKNSSINNNQANGVQKKGIEGLNFIQEPQQREIFQKPEPKPQQLTHQDGITSIILYDTIRDKKIIATGSIDTTIRLWNLEQQNFEHIKTLQGHRAPITCMKRFEREGVCFIASGDGNHEIKIWNPSLAGNELITTLLGHFQGGICSLIYHNDYLISSSKDNSLKVWNLEELKCIQTINHDQYSTCISECKDFMIGSTYDGFKIYQFQNDVANNVIYKLKSYNNKAHRSGIQKICPIESEEVDLATSGKDGLIKLWNIAKGICVRQLKKHTDSVYDMVFLKDKLISSGRDGLKIWDKEECILERNNNHKYVRDDILGQIIVIEEYNCAASVGNGDSFIKIIPF